MGKINDAHCHYGKECLWGTVGRMRLISNNTYEKIIRDLDTYEIENQVLFAQPCPSSPGGYIRGALLLLPKLMAYSSKTHWEIAKGLLFEKIGKDYADWDQERYFDELFFGDVDYSNANLEISQINDKRIKPLPFVNSKFKPSDLGGLEGIEGVKYYEPYGEIPEILLKYLNDNELNILPHLSLNTLEKPEKFLGEVAKNDGIIFQVPHWGTGFIKVINALDEYDNLYIDTAASTHYSYNKRLKIPFKKIAEEHPDKILFGSDEPWTNLGKEIKKISGLGLDKGVMEKIMYSNYYKVWK
jgi:hypothetical protein